MSVPKFSPERKSYLYSAQELSALCGLSRKTVLKWFASKGVYKEEHAEAKQGSTGGVSVYYVDPKTLTENQRARLPIYKDDLESRVALSSRNSAEMRLESFLYHPRNNSTFYTKLV